MSYDIIVPIEILLIEDSEADADLVKETLSRSKLPANLHIVQNGEDAMTFLRRQGTYSDALRPNLILLDLNLPKKDGREVLQEVKEDPDLCRIPTIVLTSSAAEDDVSKSYQFHANCYIVKPLDFKSFMVAVQQLADFWFSLVILPKR